MKIEDFDYHLPEELIAQKPAEKRDAGKTVETRGQRDLFGEAFAAGGGEGLRKRWNPAGGISV